MRPHRILLGGLTRIAAVTISRKVGFLIAGAQKGGTFALDGYLRCHPQIGMADVKELHFFDHDEHFQNHEPPYPAYHSHFKSVWLRKILGESTPEYMYWHAAPERIRRYNPAMKFIMILRNPIDRAYSQWNMKRDNLERKTGEEVMPFWETIQQEMAHGRQAASNLPRAGYVHRGFYVEQLERVWACFPKTQTLILKSEDLRKNYSETLDKVCRFLGVATPKHIPALDIHSRKYVQPMQERERQYLKDIFQPEIKKLEQLLGWDCNGWLADAKKPA